ncbi:MAG: ATP-binding cassette domain-containing protein, partial [Candidatus Bathyarchaeia archaeon]
MLLRCEGLSKRFGGIVAVNNLSFDLKENEILGIIGPNGAGKTTVLNLISGFYKPSSGTILFNGRRVDGLSPNIIARLGIARTFQIPRPFKNLTVFQNLLIAA